MDGYEATRRIRAAEIAEGCGAHVPIVAVTANAIEGDREVCIAAGMDAHLGKPFLRQDLHAILARWLPRSEIVAAASPLAEAEIHAMFLADGRRLVAELEGALARADHDTAARAAHSLRSVASHVEAAELAAVCAELEGKLRTGATGGLEGALQAVATRFEGASADIEAARRNAETLAPPPAAPTTAAAEPAPCALVVDDEPNDRFLIGRVLKRLGFTVEECDSGSDALSICRRHRPDLVVLDGIMPGMDGVQTCVALRAEEGLRELPIIMVSGIQDETWQSRARAAGATAVVDKSVAARKLADDLGLAIAAIAHRPPPHSGPAGA
jgi:CheY-like chemotaxis protein